mgnify:FL=1
MDDFLKDWHKVPEFDGALLTGSYATGTPSAQSDIDVMLVLSDQATYYQRGNCLHKGLMIEYIAQPKSEWQHSFVKDQKNRTKLSTSMFTAGKVIFDPKGLV